MRKGQWAIIVVAVAALLIFTGAIPLSPLGSGSGWEFDYRLTTTTVNGLGFNDDCDSDPVTTTYTGGGGGGGSIFYTMSSLLMNDAYHQVIDVDGSPVSNWLYGVHTGLAPNLDIQMSQVWRVDADGNELPMSAPAEREFQVGEETHYLYHYAFAITFATISQQFTGINQVGVAYQTAEAGELTGNTLIQVSMQETIFGDVDGEFMSATVIDTGTNLDELYAGGYVFAVYPDASLINPNSALEIQNRDYSDTHYNCFIKIPFDLQCGLTRIDLGQNYVPANVWVRLTIGTELLLREPLNIGDEGDNNDGGLPPVYTPPFDLRLVAIIAFGFIVLVVVLYFWSRSKAKQSVNVNVSRGYGYRGYNLIGVGL